MTTTRAATRLETEAMTLFGVTKLDSISSVLWALGIRQACGRCGGSGHYSRNSMGSTICYDCKGRKERAAKLTKATLAAARVKVEAGELDACRARAAAIKAARAEVAPKVAAGRAIYEEIGAAYERGYQAGTLRGNEALCRAQGLNNDLFWGECPSRAFRRAPAQGMRDIERAVEEGRIDALTACARLDTLLGMLTELRDAWRAWEPARLRAGAHARLAA